MKLKLYFGALVQPLKRQLCDAGLKLPVAYVEAWQHDADAVTRLVIRGMLSEVESRAARKRILRAILSSHHD